MGILDCQVVFRLRQRLDKSGLLGWPYPLQAGCVLRPWVDGKRVQCPLLGWESKMSHLEGENGHQPSFGPSVGIAFGSEPGWLCE